MKKSFRDRDPLAMGVVGVAGVALLVFGAFNLTILRGGTVYHAAFTEAGGLKPDEDVRVAGVKVGKVKGVSLEGDHVRVAFTAAGDVHFGTLSQVRIKLATILGAHYLDIEPAGGRPQPPGQEIPTSRTAPAYEIVPALQDLSGQLQKIDVPQLATAFDTLSQTLSGSPDNVRRTLTGLRKISTAISSRDDSLNDLLTHGRRVTGLLADRTGDLAALVSDGGRLLQTINDRRQVIRSLLAGTLNLSTQITGMIQENKATLHPALTQLHQVIGILERNQGNLESAIQTLGPFVTVSGDATAQGRWFDGYLQNLLPLPLSIGAPQPPVDDAGRTGSQTGSQNGGQRGRGTTGRGSDRQNGRTPTPSATPTPGGGLLPFGN